MLFSVVIGIVLLITATLTQGTAVADVLDRTGFINI